MTLLDTPFDDARANPLDRLEKIVAANQWPFEREGEDEMTFSIGGSQAHYHLWFGWHPDMGALELRCAIDVAVPVRRFTEVAEVLTRINTELWLGHFDCDPGEPGIVFRHTLLSAGATALQAAELETLVEVAIASCERCYPAFMLLLWGGKAPRDAVAAAMLETIGEA
jgi:hypothetical protein